MNPDRGSKKPLNWIAPSLHAPVEKSTTHAERTEAYFRFGTPPTRWGTFNGAVPNFSPNPYIPALNPPLTLDLGKSLGDGNKEIEKMFNTPSVEQQDSVSPFAVQAPQFRAQRKQAFSRVVDDPNKENVTAYNAAGHQQQLSENASAIPSYVPPESSKLYQPPTIKPVQQAPNLPLFGKKQAGSQGVGGSSNPASVEATPSGVVATGGVSGVRRSQTRQALDLFKALGTMQVPMRDQDSMNPAQSKIPGQPGVPGMSGMPDASNQDVIGISPTGLPIYEDPFHPAHRDFDAADHMTAADQHEKMGDPLGAQAHTLMADDQKSPMDRFSGRFGSVDVPVNGQPEGGRTLMAGQPQGNLQPGNPLARELPGQGPGGGMGPGGPKRPGPGGPPVGQMSGLMGTAPGPQDGPPKPPAATMASGPLTPGDAGPARSAMEKPTSGALGPVGGPPNPGQGPADIGTGDAKGDPFASLLAKLSPDQGKPVAGNPLPDRQGPKPGMQIAAPSPGSSTVQVPAGTPSAKNQSAGPLAPTTHAAYQGTYVNPDPDRTVQNIMQAQDPSLIPQPVPTYAKALEQFLALV